MNSKILLTTGSAEEQAKAELDGYYAGNLIPAEKKPFFTDLRKGFGAYLPIEKNRFILDGSSQIATLGLGFNPSVFFGVMHFPEAWLNLKSGADFAALRAGYEAFFKRKLAWSEAHAFFSNAGAEANEIALGDAYARRRSKKARKVLAFEGSFHGRMLITLGATANAAKRIPYEWPSFQAVFAQWPEMKTDHSRQPAAPEGWNAAWERAARNDFTNELAAFRGVDALIDAEIASLLDVRDKLKTGDVYAVILEPRQCEGGDRYASFRFHNGLVNLCRSLGVAVIYDEVQCGYGLAGEFFWHRIFDLRDGAGQPIGPDYVTCAKKAQLGVTLSRYKIEYPEQFASHSLIRGYAQGLMMDQNRARVREMADYVRPRLEAWVSANANELEHPRLQGLSFSVDFKDKALLDAFIAKRFEKGLMYYPAGSNTARFRLNLSYRKEDIDLLLKECQEVLDIARGKAVPGAVESRSEAEDTAAMWDFHVRSVRDELDRLRGAPRKVDRAEAVKHAQTSATVRELGLEAIWVTAANFKDYRAAIAALEDACYEPARRTPLADFERAMASKLGFGIVLKKGKELAGICFMGDMNVFPYERGARNDSHFAGATTLYSFDLTVAGAYQGRGLGQVLKQCAYLGALAQGATRIEGRNRDGLAAAMWAINLSLGAYQTQHLANDYPDDHETRDCIFYSTRIGWDPPALSLANAVDAPWGLGDLSPEFIERAAGAMVNKVCLSNWVSRGFLDDLRSFSELLHPDMRHAYTASGQSECVDKAIKSIWSYRKHERVLSFEGCHFGAGSFMARSLSGVGDKLFPVTHLPFPTEANWRDVLVRVESELKAAPTHSVWIEPLTQRTLQRAPAEFLTRLVEVCRAHGAASVFNDTASLFFRYSQDAFVASRTFGPDVAISFVGGQMGIVYCRKEFFVAKPLEIISTWDGDEYSLAAFAEAARRCVADSKNHHALQARFDEALTSYLKQFSTNQVDIKNGVGSFVGVLPPPQRAWFRAEGDRHYVAANADGMRRFVAHVKGSA